MTQGLDGPREYRSLKASGWRAAAFIAGGVVFLLLLIFQFLLGLIARSDKTDRMMPGIIGGLSAGGIVLILRGVALLKGPRRIIIDSQGVRVDGFISSQQVLWTQIHSIRLEKKSEWLGTASIDQLVLLDEDGKLLAEIPSHIDRFSEAAGEIESRANSARGAPTGNPEADRQLEVRSANKTRWFLISASALLVTGFAIGLIAGINESLHTRRYATEGVKTDAKVVRHYMRSVTPWIEYTFDDAGGQSFTRNTSMDKAAWTVVEGQPTVAIEYLSSNPDWNRLVIGETQAEMFGGNFLFVTGGGLLLFTAMLAFAILGWDIRTEDGKLKLVKMGAPRAQAAPRQVAVTIAPPPSWPTGQPTSPLAPSRPTGLIVLGILAIVFGFFGLARGALMLALMLKGSLILGDREMVFLSEPWLVAWTAVDMALAAGLIVAGAGLAALRGWARKLAIVVAALQILSSLAAIIVNIVLAAQEELLPGEEGLHQAASTIGGIIGSLIAAALPTVILIICARRRTARSLR